MANEDYVKIKLRRDTAANWASDNPTLALGEAGVDMTNHRLKVGDGSTVWNSLPYIAPDVVDALTSRETAKALSANQGWVLKNLIDNLIVDNLYSSSTTKALSANQGRILEEEIESLQETINNGGSAIKSMQLATNGYINFSNGLVCQWGYGLKDDLKKYNILELGSEEGHFDLERAYYGTPFPNSCAFLYAYMVPVVQYFPTFTYVTYTGNDYFRFSYSWSGVTPTTQAYIKYLAIGY